VGYFGGARGIRLLGRRSPLLAEYVKLLASEMAGSSLNNLPELQSLKRILDKQLQSAAEVAKGSVELGDADIHPAPGIQLRRIIGGSIESPLSLRPSSMRSGARRPMVLDNSNRPEQRQYYPWLARPDGITVEREHSRTVLPGTSWKADWISPEHDFLAEKLIILESSLYPERVRLPAGISDQAARVLIPLKQRFFEFFDPIDVPGMLNITTSGPDHDLKVAVELTVPTAAGRVKVKKEYSGGTSLPAHLSLWPGFVTDEGDLHDYYAML
jgi:hypothetical protein